MRVTERHVRGLVAYTGQRNCFQIGWIHQGTIQKIVVQQIAGPTQDFRVKVFNSRRPCLDTSQSSGGGGNPAGFYEASPELYKVFPTWDSRTSPKEPDADEFQAGRIAVFKDAAGRYYRNKDGDETTPQYFIYLDIEPYNLDNNGNPIAEGAGTPVKFDVALCASVDIC